MEYSFIYGEINDATSSLLSKDIIKKTHSLCPQAPKHVEVVKRRTFTWGVQVLRYPNFFLGNGSR